MDEADQPVALPITDVFDLHAVPPRDAKTIVEEYLLQAHSLGFRHVRIIHGRGIGVQREMVRTLLRGLPFVAHFSDAPPEAGGWGATVVMFAQVPGPQDQITMNPLTEGARELESLRIEYNDILARADAIFSSVSAAEFQRPPQPGAWSIAECFDHLNKTDRMYAGRIADAIAKGKRERIVSAGPFRYSWLQRYFVRKTEPPVAFRVRAPKTFAPAAQADLQQCAAEFRKWNRELVRLTEEAEGLDLKRIQVPSPVAEWLKWSLGIVFHICAAHDRRHLYQARQVLERIR